MTQLLITLMRMPNGLLDLGKRYTNLDTPYPWLLRVFIPIGHEARRIYPPYNFWIGFCQLILYQKFPNIFGDEN